ncbi:hypothetical protein FOMPIDRAFT_129139 [Fomitopsis schrenkii]|uniref:Isopenicillin N synthase-like Fe(2+) 2OG dioxygenase domain-containing protein n=1 Tax=Fomitopsis schrenkii TaxID=2126942 RepID=S8FN40_FOMSC|nr:hypothetical protein FOMPIDRAFT_129139 [Fomitopsis schrenkii]
MAGVTSFPLFPDDVPTHPLLVMFAMGAETMALPMEEKMKCEHGDDGISFGYGVLQGCATREMGTLDTAEFINVSKEDAIAWPEQVHRAYPPTVNAHMASTITLFIEKSLEVNNALLAVLNEKLGLSDGTLLAKHDLREHSGSEARCIRSPPMPAGSTPDKAALGSHTDFGSLSFLHNRLGGLQVMVPGSSTWLYVKSIPGHAICNLGDAMTILSGGILKSKLHRVVSPSKARAQYVRWPGNSIVLRPLIEDGALIATAVANSPSAKFGTEVTAQEWFARRIMNQRI